MKVNDTKVQKKAAKKVAKKELEKTLTEKFFEAVKGLGHDAEIFAEDISKAAKAAAKKLSKKFSGVEEEVSPAAVSKLKNKVPKDLKKAQKTVKKAASKIKPIIQSVKVATVALEESTSRDVTPPKKKIAVKAKNPVKTVTNSTESVKKVPLK